MTTVKIFWIIFAVHLIPVIWVSYCVARYPESSLLWLIFTLLDFPLGWLFYFAYDFIHWVSESDFWRFVLWPALFFQIIGTVNWLLIYLVARWLIKVFWCP